MTLVRTSSASNSTLPLVLRSATYMPARIPAWMTTASARRGRFLAIRLASCLYRGSERLFLRLQNFFSSISPLLGLFAGIVGPFAHEVAAFFGLRHQDFAGLASRLRGIQNSYFRADSQPGKKPQRSTSISVRHR